MRNLHLLLPLLLCLFLCPYLSNTLWAQNTTINIGIVNDREPDSDIESSFEKNVEAEILTLLQHRYDVNFKTYYIDNKSDIDSQFSNVYSASDIVIFLGVVSTNYAVSLKTYPKPTIGTSVLDAQLQGLQKTSDGTSGIKNFSYIESPFDIARDLNLLYELYPFDHLEILTEEGALGETAFIKQFFNKYLEGKEVIVDHILYKDEIEQHFKDMGAKKVAVYALPYFGERQDRVSEFFKIINRNKIPSAALLGEQYLAAGALAGYETSNNLQKIPRRVALTVMKIVEGEKAADLSVEMQNFSENLLLNMETARQIEIYPTFDLMAKATLLNLDKVQVDKKISLQEAVAEVLQQNLDIRIQESNINIADTEIGIAKSDMLPQLDANLSFQVLDETTTFTRQGAAGRGTAYLGGSVSQVVLAEPLLANIAIQKMLKESEEKALLQTQMDAVLDVTNAYMNIIFAKSNLNIQQQNVERNKENYDISKTKEAIGYTGASDINRWEAELANANINLNNAIASLRQAKFLLNQLLNRPIDQAMEIEEISLENASLLVADSRMDFLNDYGKLKKFSNFLVKYGMENLPELAQIDLGLKVQERLQLSRERAMYLPTVGVSGNVNKVLGKVAVPDGLMPLDNIMTWDASIGVSYPIFQGNNRKNRIEQSKFNVLQFNDTRKNISNQLEFLIRANMETIGASYSQMTLSQIAADASQKNYDIVKDAYSAGQTNITTLIDAQNNALGTELNASNAIFSFIQDFVALERSFGYFNFLATSSERDAFFQQIEAFMEN